MVICSRQQVGVPDGTTARGLLARPGDERLDADWSRCHREARLRTRPGRAGLIRIEPPRRANWPVHGHGKARKVGREYVPLHRDATITAVDPLGQTLARDSAAQTGLREPQRRRDDRDRRTGARSLARQVGRKGRRGRRIYGFTKGLLEAPITVLFDTDVMAEPQQGISKLPVETLPMGCFLLSRTV